MKHFSSILRLLLGRYWNTKLTSVEQSVRSASWSRAYDGTCLCVSSPVKGTLMPNLRRLEKSTSPASNFDTGMKFSTSYAYSEWHAATLFSGEINAISRGRMRIHLRKDFRWSATFQISRSLAAVQIYARRNFDYRFRER